MLRFHVVDHFILGGRWPLVSKHHSDCVKGEICLKEIVSNTRLDLNHLFFTHLVCEFLIICRFLLIYIYLIFVYYFCLSHLFVLLLILRFVYCFFCFITKINCWNISNIGEYIYIYIYQTSTLKLFDTKIFHSNMLIFFL